MALGSSLLRLVRWFAVAAFAVALLIAFLAGFVLLGANTDRGRAYLASAAADLTGGQVRIAGITGRFPDDLRIARIELADASGIWLGIDDLALVWSPRRLVSGELAVQALSAARIAVARLPAPGEASSGGGGFALPLRIDLQRLRIDRIDLAQPVFGTPAAFAADGHARVPSLDRVQAKLSLQRLDQPGAYRLDASQDAGGLHAKLSVHEPGDGLLATAAGVAQLGPLTLEATADGPPDALALRLALEAGGLRADADGMVNSDHRSGEIVLSVNEFGPVAALAGLDLRGGTRLTLRAALTPGATHLEAEGSVALTGGLAPLPALIGRDAKLRLVADVNGGNLLLTHFSLTGAAASATAQGTMKGDTLDVGWSLGLAELRLLAPTLDGALQATGRVAGPLTDLTARADLTGTVTPAGIKGGLPPGIKGGLPPGIKGGLPPGIEGGLPPGMEGGPLTAHIEAHGLPGAPRGKITASGHFAGAPLDLAVDLARQPDGTLDVKIERVAWRSAHLQGSLSLPSGALVPIGRVDLKFDRLADLAPLLGRPLSGAVMATLDSTAQHARLNLEARNAGLAGIASAGIVKLAAEIADPAHPVVKMKLLVETLRHHAIPDPVRLTADAALDIHARQATISTLNAGWNKEALRLLNPVRVSFADIITIDRLRLGLRQAVFEAAGQLAPTLDLTASLRGVTPDLAALFAPGLQADGLLGADVRLIGPPARPSGTIRIEASGLRPRGGAARGLPPAKFNATANLADGRANIDARLTAGTATLAVAGLAPLAGGPIDLRADGTVNLALLEPLLSAAGRRIGGQVALSASLRGTLAEPRIDGQVSLTNGTIQDYATGLHLTAIAATLHGEGGILRIDRFTGRAGPNQGRVDMAGSIGVLAPGMPIDLTLTARNARPLSNDLLSATFDADLALRGPASDDLTLSGTIKLLRADIRLPERLPASIPVLKITRPGARPPPPAPGPDIRLDLTLNAPRQIFVRGRGLDAELGGSVHLAGTLANPQPDGRFQLRRGDFSLAGQTLTFSKGEIGFDGASLADPSLNFLASRSGTGVTANLAITGTASSPKITLSSSPPLPQDEVLAQLLLGRSAITLQPLELAQIAAALASLTGATSGIGDPLNSVRTELGLDRLSIGSNGGGSTLNAGRYVAPGVYVGARQSLSGSGTQSVVQIDIAKGLKLEGSLGTGTASATGSQSSQGSGVAVIYEMDY